jgi:hypothetical protein
MIRKRFSINELYNALIVRDTRFFLEKYSLVSRSENKKKYEKKSCFKCHNLVFSIDAFI